MNPATGRNLKKILSNIFQFLFAPLPSFGWGNAFRGKALSMLLKSCGPNFKVAPLANVYNPSRVKVGKNVYIGYCSYLGDGDIELADEVVIGPFCSITAGNHLFRNGSVRFGGYEYRPISIGFGAWIGAHVCILAGTRIGQGVTVAAGAVVTRDVPDYAIVAGVPARIVGQNSQNSGVQASNQEGMKA